MSEMYFIPDSSIYWREGMWGFVHTENRMWQAYEFEAQTRSPEWMAAYERQWELEGPHA